MTHILCGLKKCGVRASFCSSSLLALTSNLLHLSFQLLFQNRSGFDYFSEDGTIQIDDGESFINPLTGGPSPRIVGSLKIVDSNKKRRQSRRDSRLPDQAHVKEELDEAIDIFTKSDRAVNLFSNDEFDVIDELVSITTYSYTNILY